VKRTSNDSIVPSSNYLEIVSNDEIYIRQGQLNEQNINDGIGRKIKLTPKNVNQVISSFNQA